MHESHERTRRGARLVAIGILASRIVGLIRNWIYARYIPAGAAADAYTAAIKIPNILRNLLGEGAISASFIPVYAAALARGDEKGARALANALLGVLLAAVAVLTALGIWVAPVLTALFAPGFTGEKAELTTRLMRVIFPMTGLMVLSGWCLGVQNAHRRFLIAYGSAVLWSVTQIGLLLVAGPRTEIIQLVWWLSWATLAGAALQVAAQMPQVLRLLGPLRPRIAAVPGLRETLHNFTPIVAALGVFQVSSLIDTFIASFLPDGANQLMQWATQLYLLPLGLFGVSTAAAALPEFAASSARNEHDVLRAGLTHAWERVLFYVIPSTVAFIAIGDLIIALVYESGRFGPDDRYLVHLVLAGFAIALIAYSSSRVLTSTYYALQDFHTPFRAALVAVTTSAVGSLAVALPFRSHLEATAAIAAGGAVGAYVNLLMLWRGLRKHLGAIDTTGPRRVAAGATAAAAAAAAVGLAAHWFLRALPVHATAALVIPVYCLVFLGVAHRLRLDEAERMVAGLRRRLLRR